MPYLKNTAQTVYIYAFDTTTGGPAVGDQANITAEISKDGAASSATTDLNPTQLESVDHPGIYGFNITAAEFNCDVLVITPTSTTEGVEIDPIVIRTLDLQLIAGDADKTLVQYPAAINTTAPTSGTATYRIPVRVFDSNLDPVDLDALPGGLAATITKADGSAAAASAGAAVKETGTGRYYIPITVTTTAETLIGEITAARTASGVQTLGFTLAVKEPVNDLATTVVQFPDNMKAPAAAGTFRMPVRVLDGDLDPVDLDALPGGLSATITKADGSAAAASVGTAVKESGTGRYYIPITTTSTEESIVGEITATRSASGTQTLGFTMELANSGGGGGGAGTGAAMLAGTAQGGTVSTIQLASGAITNDDILNNRAAVAITAGTGFGQARLIVDSVASTDTVTVDENWVVTPDNTSEYVIISAAVPWNTSWAPKFQNIGKG